MVFLLSIGLALACKAQYDLLLKDRWQCVHDSYDRAFLCVLFLQKSYGSLLHPLSSIYTGIKSIWLAIFSILLCYDKGIENGGRFTLS